MNKPEDSLDHEIRWGDLRPQLNPRSLAALGRLPMDGKCLEPSLIDRLGELARPIADASRGLAASSRLHDAGNFFYLVETFHRLGGQKLDETLLTILDEFALFTEDCYNELYLWSIVHLSRVDLGHVRSLWPQVIRLDRRFRAAPWRRPAGTQVFEQPYRMTDLLFYYYVIFTLVPRSRPSAVLTPGPVNGIRTDRFPSLARCLKAIAPTWSFEEGELVTRALRELKVEDQPHRAAVYSDALGFLKASP